MKWPDWTDLTQLNIGPTQHRDNLVNSMTFLCHLKKILSGLKPGLDSLT
jgi:hypothetical protein